jgi:hypothetical protein
MTVKGPSMPKPLRNMPWLQVPLDVRIITPPVEGTKGWDAANASTEGWSQEMVAQLLGSASPFVDKEAWPSPDLRLITGDGIHTPVFPTEVLRTWGEWCERAAEQKSAPIETILLPRCGPEATVSYVQDRERIAIVHAPLLRAVAISAPPSQSRRALLHSIHPLTALLQRSHQNPGLP